MQLNTLSGVHFGCHLGPRKTIRCLSLSVGQPAWAQQSELQAVDASHLLSLKVHGGDGAGDRNSTLQPDPKWTPEWIRNGGESTKAEKHDDSRVK